MSTPEYAELHCHSYYSYREGASSIGELLARRCETLMDRPNGTRALADRGGNPLHRTEAHIAGCEDAGPGRFEGQRCGPVRVRDVGAGKHEALGVEFDDVVLKQIVPASPGSGEKVRRHSLDTGVTIKEMEAREREE